MLKNRNNRIGLNGITFSTMQYLTIIIIYIQHATTMQLMQESTGKNYEISK